MFFCFYGLWMWRSRHKWSGNVQNIVKVNHHTLKSEHMTYYILKILTYVAYVGCFRNQMPMLFHSLIQNLMLASDLFIANEYKVVNNTVLLNYPPPHFEILVFCWLKRRRRVLEGFWPPSNPFRKPPSTKKISISKGPPFGFSRL